MIPAGEVSKLVERLERGEVAPRLISFDRDLADLSPAFNAYVTKCYAPVADGVPWPLVDGARKHPVILLSRQGSCQ